MIPAVNFYIVPISVKRFCHLVSLTCGNHMNHTKRNLFMKTSNEFSDMEYDKI